MNGGTPNKAPAGYRNVRTFDAQCREARIVEVDEERAQIIRWGFTTYATGEWSLHRLARGMTQLGFTLAPRAGKPPRVLTVSMLQRMLRNPYYCGIVTYLGVEYPGTHEPLVEPALWRRVQDALTARRNTSTRDVHTLPEGATPVRGVRVVDDVKPDSEQPRDAVLLLRVPRPPQRPHQLHVESAAGASDREGRTETDPTDQSHPGGAAGRGGTASR